jgi:toxin ParE1/3/4
MKIRWLKNGIRSMRAVYHYIALADPAAAQRTSVRIDKAVGQLSVHPRSGRPGAVPGTRELVIRGLPYLVVYRITESEVQIIRVFHAKQDRPSP